MSEKSEYTRVPGFCDVSDGKSEYTSHSDMFKSAPGEHRRTHECQETWEKSGNSEYTRCGFLLPHSNPLHTEIPYRAIVPKAGECGNLLVPWALSATHIAFGSIRMEPVFMVLGQSAGTAACIAIDAGISVQAVPYKELRARLRSNDQRLDL